MKLSRMWLCAFSAIIALSPTAYAKRQWEKIQVPGAVCGSGDPYSIFFSRGDDRRVALALEGGGACWDYDSCYGMIHFTDLYPKATVSDKAGFFSDNHNESTVATWSMFYFPYCTGDVFTGTHETVYANKKTYHHGKINMDLAISLLTQQY